MIPSRAISSICKIFASHRIFASCFRHGTDLQRVIFLYFAFFYLLFVFRALSSRVGKFFSRNRGRNRGIRILKIYMKFARRNLPMRRTRLIDPSILTLRFAVTSRFPDSSAYDPGKIDGLNRTRCATAAAAARLYFSALGAPRRALIAPAITLRARQVGCIENCPAVSGESSGIPNIPSGRRYLGMRESGN